MADVQKAHNPLVSLFEPSTQHPDSNKTCFLSFAALADFNSQQRGFHSNTHNTWPGAPNWKMGDAPIHHSRPEGEAESNALEAFDLNDYYHYNLDSPQSHFAITPSDRSSTGYILGDAGAIAPAFSSTSYPSIVDIGYDGESASDERNIFSSGACSSNSLNSKTSQASFASSISAQSEYLLTPRQSTTSNPYSWEDVSGAVGGSPATSQYPSRWTGEPNVKSALCQSRASVWSSSSAVDTIPLSLTDSLDGHGQEEEAWSGAMSYPSINVPYRRSLSGRHNSSSYQPTAAFPGRELASTFDMSNTYANAEPFAAEGSSSTSPSLLPPASILGNMPGWESSSPTYPSMVDFQTAALNHTDMYGGQGSSATISEAGPSGLGAAYLSVPGGISMRKARSTDGIEHQTAERTRALFAFHPVDTPVALPLEQSGPYGAIPTSAQTYFPLQPIAPLSLTRRNTSSLQVRIPSSSTAGSGRYSGAMSRAHTQPGPLDPAMMYTTPPPTASYTGMITPAYYYPPPTSREAEFMHYTSVPPPSQPSVLASAPGGIHVAPPLSATIVTHPQQAVTTGESSRSRTCSQSRRTPQLIPASEPLPTIEPVTVPSPEPTVEARPIVSLPTKRKTSQPKSRKASGTKGKASDGGAISFGSFINYTAKDAAVIQAGVAPSGSKTKRRSDDEGDRPAKRSRSAESS